MLQIMLNYALLLSYLLCSSAYRNIILKWLPAQCLYLPISQSTNVTWACPLHILNLHDTDLNFFWPWIASKLERATLRVSQS